MLPFYIMFQRKDYPVLAYFFTFVTWHGIFYWKLVECTTSILCILSIVSHSSVLCSLTN